jgi:cell pole-organizing protein PopZ
MSQSNSNSEPTMDEILASIRKIISEDQPEADLAAVPEEVAAPEKATAAEEYVSAEAAVGSKLGAEITADEVSLDSPEPEIPAEPERSPEPSMEEPLAASVSEPVALVAPVVLADPIILADHEPARGDVFAEVEEAVSFDNDTGSFDNESGLSDIEESSMETYSDEAAVEEEFISSTTRDALDQAFEQIDEAPALEPVSPPSDGSLEAVFTRAVQEAFDPTLQSWVDSHGEDIVARLSPLIREWMDENLPPLVEAAVTKEISRAVRSRRR